MSVIWSPDGREVLFNAEIETESGLQLFRKRSDGTGTETPVLADDRAKYPLHWSRDGRLVLFDRFDAVNGTALWLLPLAEGGKATAFAATPFSERSAQFSPDGRWIAYTSNESGQREVYLTRLGGDGGRWQVSAAGGDDPRWSGDGKELFIYTMNAIAAVPITRRNDVPDLGPAVKLFDARAPEGLTRYFYDVAPDGRFLISVPTSETMNRLTLLVNWPSALQER